MPSRDTQPRIEPTTYQSQGGDSTSRPLSALGRRCSPLQHRVATQHLVAGIEKKKTQRGYMCTSESCVSVMCTINRLCTMRRRGEGGGVSLSAFSLRGWPYSPVFKSLATEGGVINLVTFSFVPPGGLRQD